MKYVLIIVLIVSFTFVGGCRTVNNPCKDVVYNDIDVTIVHVTTNDNNTIVVDEKNIRHRVYGEWGKEGDEFKINESHFGEK
jgi:hypothetical protein